MKVKPICAICLLERGFKQAKMATDDEELQKKAVQRLLEFLAKNFDSDHTPPHIGYLRDQIILEAIGKKNQDIYSKLKKHSNEMALEILPDVRKWIEEASDSQKERFRRACIISIVGNIMEFDISGHTFDLRDLPKVINDAEIELVIDDIDKVFQMIQEKKNILFLPDNAGEIAFDTLLVEELKRNNCQVTVAVKEKYIMNDATLEDALLVGMDKVADKLMTTGTNPVTAGLNINEASKEFMEEYKKAELIIAKGMGHFETLTEFKLPIPIVHLLRTKCEPVANSLGVARHRNVAKIS
ncbi:MAG: damage-control phosphatase ARMT1 family protein [Candidatus Sifarchaeia archaeon]|jgi:uncharacterized protein with ATP-grasp and redox domains